MNFLIKSPHDGLVDIEVLFAHTDSEELYKKNLKKYGSDWYYANNPITYKFNKLGYRMKQLEEVDYDNYYAFFGCSFTAGIGINVEDTFAYKISKRANVDYINASISGSGVDFVYHNFINLTNGAPKKPKIVFINWPPIYRNFYWEEGNIVRFMLPGSMEDSHWKRTYKDFIVMDTQVFNRFDVIRKSIQLICKLSNIPLFEMSTDQDIENMKFSDRNPTIITDIIKSNIDFENTRDLHMNCARDIHARKNSITSHPGFLHQDAIVDKFFEVMK